MSNVVDLVRVKNTATRDGYDLGGKVAYTAKTGEILPIKFWRVLPGDKMEINYTHFMSTAPLNSSAFTRIREYANLYFVPYRYLWRFFPSFFTSMLKNVKSAVDINNIVKLSDKTPYLSSQAVLNYVSAVERSKALNPVGLLRSQMTRKLLHYLGYNSVAVEGQQHKNHALDPFPLLAYQLIYQDMIRNNQWEDANPSAFNVDYLPDNTVSDSYYIPVQNIKTDKATLDKSAENLFDLRYCDYEKDMFFGLLPRAQYGEASVVPVDINTSSSAGTAFVSSDEPFTSDSAVASAPINPNVYYKRSASSDRIGTLMVDQTGEDIPLKFRISSSDMPRLAAAIAGRYSSQFSVLDLRKSQAVQKLREIQISNSQDYKEQIEAIFGVHVAKSLSQRCTWVDGVDRQININPAFNTNFNDGGNSQIKGNGTGNLELHTTFENTTGEVGILMLLYYNRPIQEYDLSGDDPLMDTVSLDQYPNPVLDRIGNEVITGESFSGMSGSFPLGYGSRYLRWKTSIDLVRGGFSKAFGGTYTNWVNPVDPTSQFNINSQGFLTFNYKSFKVRPNILDTTFTVKADNSVNSDQFLVNDFVGCTCLRQLSRKGLPF